jgi:hypothetical protein
MMRATLMGDYVYCDICVREVYKTASARISSICANVHCNKCKSVNGTKSKGKFAWLPRGRVTYTVHPTGFLQLNKLCFACEHQLEIQNPTKPDLQIYKEMCGLLQEKVKNLEEKISEYKRKYETAFPDKPSEPSEPDDRRKKARALDFISLESPPTEVQAH